MLFTEPPYFMTNPEWFVETLPFESEDGRGYHLTENAPEEAVQSYNEFYDTIESQSEPIGV